MKARKKLLKKIGSLGSVSSKDLFTELMKRVPTEQRFSMFIHIHNDTYLNDKGVIYSLYHNHGDDLITTKPIKKL